MANTYPNYRKENTNVAKLCIFSHTQIVDV